MIPDYVSDQPEHLFPRAFPQHKFEELELPSSLVLSLKPDPCLRCLVFDPMDSAIITYQTALLPTLLPTTPYPIHPLWVP